MPTEQTSSGRRCYSKLFVRHSDTPDARGDYLCAVGLGAGISQVVKTLTQRGWATPLTIGAFFLMAGTGAVIFFKFDKGLMASIHRWFSWIFVAGAINHVAANVRPFTNYLRSTLGRSIAAIFLAILLASFFSWGRMTSQKLINPIETAILGAPLNVVADLEQTSPDVLIARLWKQKIAASPGQSLRDIGMANGVGEERLLGLVFLPD